MLPSCWYTCQVQHSRVHLMLRHELHCDGLIPPFKCYSAIHFTSKMICHSASCRYDIAASTSCSALDYIVVDTTSDAQRAVELLRKGELGVATFLILEKQRALEREMNQQVDTPEGKHKIKVASCNWFNQLVAVTWGYVLAVYTV